jgi:monoamine oxidase
LITKWDKDPYSLGSYSFLKVGSTMEDTKNIKKSIDEKLWIVGEHCYGQYLGCVFGAFGTGKKAA